MVVSDVETETKAEHGQREQRARNKEERSATSFVYQGDGEADGHKLGQAGNNGGEVVVDTGPGSVKDVHCLEDKDIYTRPHLEEHETHGKKDRMERLARKEYTEKGLAWSRI